MATYGLFGGNVKEPMQTYTGDEMAQSGEYVYIFKRVPIQESKIPKKVQVAAIKLADGQSVKEI